MYQIVATDSFLTVSGNGQRHMWTCIALAIVAYAQWDSNLRRAIVGAGFKREQAMTLAEFAVVT